MRPADIRGREVGHLRCGRHRRVIYILERGLIDEIDLHIAPVLLGAGIRLFDNPGGAPIRLELLNGDDPSAAVNVRYHPVATQVDQSKLLRQVARGPAVLGQRLATWASQEAKHSKWRHGA